MHAAAIKARGAWIPCAWPHDANQRSRDSGETYAAQFRAYGVAMLPEHATHKGGGNGREASVTDINERMRTDRLKIASHLEPLLSEIRTLHRKDGVLVAEYDDGYSAMRIALMSLRFAKVQGWREQRAQRNGAVATGIDYNPLAAQSPNAGASRAPRGIWDARVGYFRDEDGRPIISRN